MQSAHVDDAIARAATHGLTLNPDSVDVIEAGLDYVRALWECCCQKPSNPTTLDVARQ